VTAEVTKEVSLRNRLEAIRLIKQSIDNLYGTLTIFAKPEHLVALVDSTMRLRR
jgi:hypothetical protein